MQKTLFILAAAALLIGSGCKKQLELEPKDSLSTEVALSDMPGVNAAVVGMYASLRSVGYYGRNLFVYGDLSAADVYLAQTNSNRFLSTYQRNYAAVDADVLTIWTAMYVPIARANNIINSIDKIAGDQGEKDLAKGQAFFVRSLALFDLVRVFAKPYNQGNGAQLGVPIPLNTSVANKPPRNTVGEVYTRVIDDLKTAKTLLASTTGTTKYTATKYAASALLSRVYLYKGDYAAAIDEANLAAAGGFVLTSQANLANFYRTPGGAEEIFTVRFMSPESLGSDNLGNMYLKPGYGDIRVSPDLLNVMDPSKDKRYQAFISPFSSSPSEFQNNKFIGQDGQQGMWSPKVLRLAEVLLNRAEAYAKTNPVQTANALADLNTVRTIRGLDALAGLSGQPLIDSVLQERRRELMFEGHRYFDLTRNGLAMTRIYCSQPTQVISPNCTIAATDQKAIAPIPQAELDANPGIRGQQNEGY